MILVKNIFRVHLIMILGKVSNFFNRIKFLSIKNIINKFLKSLLNKLLIYTIFLLIIYFIINAFKGNHSNHYIFGLKMNI